jgi:hypothetical protein
MDNNEKLVETQKLLLEAVTEDLADKDKRTPSLMKVALDVLKHNNITVAKIPGGSLERLEKSVQEYDSLPQLEDDDFMDDEDFNNVIPLRR